MRTVGVSVYFDLFDCQRFGSVDSVFPRKEEVVVPPNGTFVKGCTSGSTPSLPDRIRRPQRETRDGCFEGKPSPRPVDLLRSFARDGFWSVIENQLASPPGGSTVHLQPLAFLRSRSAIFSMRRACLPPSNSVASQTRIRSPTGRSPMRSPGRQSTLTSL